MNDEEAQFVIAVGDLLVAAEQAGLTVSVLTTAADRVAGVPSRPGRPASPEDEADESGYARAFEVDGETLNLEGLLECAIRRPPPDPSSG